MLNTVLAIVWIIYVAVLLVAGVRTRALIHLLRSRHLTVWEDLGSPGPFVSYSVKTLWTLPRFLLRDEFLTLGDPEVTRVAWRAKTAMQLSYALMLAFMLLVVASALQNG